MTIAPATPPPRTTPKKAVAAAAAGNAFEWYDFTVYVLFAPYIAHAFFPGGSETVELVKAFLAFGIGFVARPVGAVLIGYYGDRVGRKAALSLTFALMAAGTGIIAFAPTYQTIGMAAPILILFGRVLQGLSAGGEIGGASAFLVEHAPAGRKAFYASWLQASMAISNILGAAVGIAMTALFSVEQIGDWAWRVPFLLGLLIAPVGIWLRRTLDETPEFTAAHAAAEGIAPVATVLAQQAANIARGFGICVLWGVSVYALIIFMPVHLQKSLGFSADAAFGAAIVGNLMLIAMSFVSGGLADRFGHRRLMIGSAVALLFGAPALMALIQAVPGVPVLVFAMAGFCGLVGLYAGAAPAVLTELFPTRVRSTATSLSYNAALTLFAGFAPAILTWLASTPAGAQAPTLYVTCAAIAALIAIRTLPGK